MNEVAETSLERHRRFDIQTEIQYRVHREKTWKKGRTVTISTSEVLFQGAGDLETGTIIDIQYQLPSISNRGIGSRVNCQGEVVRANDGFILAEVAHCRLVRV